MAPLRTGHSYERGRGWGGRSCGGSVRAEPRWHSPGALPSLDRKAPGLFQEGETPGSLLTQAGGGPGVSERRERGIASHSSRPRGCPWQRCHFKPLRNDSQCSEKGALNTPAGNCPESWTKRASNLLKDTIKLHGQGRRPGRRTPREGASCWSGCKLVATEEGPSQTRSRTAAAPPTPATCQQRLQIIF